MSEINCELCQDGIPKPEYGVMMRDEYWSAIALRPDEEFFGSGVICFDCQDHRLRERLGITLKDALAEGGAMGVYGLPTDRMRDLLDDFTIAELVFNYQAEGEEVDVDV